MGCFGKWVETFAFLTTFPFLPKRLQLEHSVWRVNHGARRATKNMVLLGLFLIFLRQLLVILESMQTDVLPVARDLCTTIRWTEGGWTSKVWRVFEPLLFVSVNEKLQELQNKTYSPKQAQFGGRTGTMHDFCHNGWNYVNFDEQLKAAWAHGRTMVAFFMVMFVFLVLPGIGRALHPHFVHDTKKGGPDAQGGDGEELDELADMREAVMNLGQDLKLAIERIDALETRAAGTSANPQ